MNIIVNVHTTWGEEIYWLVKNVSGPHEAKKKMKLQYQKAHVDLKETRDDIDIAGFYINRMEEIPDDKDVVEIASFYPPEE